MKAMFKGYVGEVVVANNDTKLFYTLDPAAKERMWPALKDFLPKELQYIPEETYCWWVDSEEELTVYDGRRRMI